MKTRNVLETVRVRFFAAIIAACSATGALAETQLTVALYPFVPRMDQFSAAIESDWQQIHPDVPLNFLDSSQWDGGYDINPPANADVYVFDAMYFEFFRQQNWLEPMAANEINQINDFIPYALGGVTVGQEYYGIPQLGCASLLFYKNSDTAIANASTLTQLKNALGGQCTYTSQIPPDRRGLMTDMSGGTTDAALYIDAAHTITGQYPYPLPQSPAELNPTAVQNLKTVLNIGSYWNSTIPPAGPYDFATWYSQRWGRAYVGYSESMSQMTEQAREKVAFKVMPFSDNPQARPSFYADIIGVNTTVHQRGTRALAVELANLMASAATMIKSIGPTGKLPPQYLMATRPSIFAALGQNYPLYTKMYSLTTSSNPVMLKLNANSRQWLVDMKGAIKTVILSNPVCGCDYPAVQHIPNNAAASAICTATCSSYGGWSGQWTNDFPAAQSGSVCGCNSCPATPQSLASPLQSRRKVKGD